MDTNCSGKDYFFFFFSFFNDEHGVRVRVEYPKSSLDERRLHCVRKPLASLAFRAFIS